VSERSYRKAGRLAEVLALIQVLAYDEDTSRGEDGLSEELQSRPHTHCSWVKLAEEHSEFFRVRRSEGDQGVEKVDRVSLVSRYVLQKIGGTNKRPPLESDVVNKLMEIAVEIHDRQLDRRDRFWKLYVPILVALIALTGKVIVG